MRRAGLVIALIALTLGLIACEKQPLVPGRVALAGDSLAFQATLFDGPGHDWDTADKVKMGWQAENAQPRVTADVAGANTSPEWLVIEFGQNDAGADGSLSTTDRHQLHELATSPHQDACVVLVKPDYIGTNATRRAGINDYRAWVDRMVALNPNGIVSVDWRSVVRNGHLDYLGPDGFHLNVPDWATWDGQPVPAAVAFLDLMQQGIDSC